MSTAPRPLDPASGSAPGAGPTPGAGSTSGRAARPRRGIGRYEIVGELGRGGMGVVYRAVDPALQRDVAIKLIRSGGSGVAVERFVREARATARLRHPGIVRVIEAGDEDGYPFIVMEYVDGPTLAALIARDGTLPPRRAATLVREVAAALAHAHDAGIVHRDVKPQNILIDRDGRPRLTDFGIARDLGASRQLTATGQLIGTPAYAAPEQLLRDPRQAGPPADVYALGAVLYQALLGRPPRDAATGPELLVRVLREEPRAPRAIDPTIPEALDAIVVGALRREPDERPADASAFAAELDRFLGGVPERRVGPEAVAGGAGPSTASLVVLGVGLAALVVAVALVVLDRGGLVAVDPPTTSTSPTPSAPGATPSPATAAAPVDGSAPPVPPATPAPPGGEPLPAGALLRIGSLALRHGEATRTLAISPDDRLVATSSWRRLRVWALAERRLVATIDLGRETPSTVAFAGPREVVACTTSGQLSRFTLEPSGPAGEPVRVRRTEVARIPGGWRSSLAPGARRIAVAHRGGDVEVIELEGEPTAAMPIRSPAPEVLSLAFDPTGTLLALGARGDGARVLEVWDVVGRARLARLDLPGDPISVAFVPDADRVMVGVSGVGMRSFPFREDGDEVGVYPPFSVHAFSPDGKTLAAVVSHGVELHRDGTLVTTIPPPPEWAGSVSRARYTSDGQRLLVTADGVIHVWDLGGPEPRRIAEPDVHVAPLTSVETDGEVIVSASSGAIRSWDAATGRPLAALEGRRGIYASALAGDGSAFAIGVNGGARVLAPATLTEVGSIPDQQASNALAFVEPGLLAIGRRDGAVLVHDVATGRSRVLDGPPGGEWILPRALEAAGGVLVTVHAEGPTRALRVSDGALLWSSEVGGKTWRRVAVGGRGRLAMTDHDDHVVLFDAETGARLRSGKIGSPMLGATAPVAIAPIAAGRDLVAVGRWDGAVLVWDAASGEPVQLFTGHRGEVRDLVFTPDGARLVSASADTTLLVWDVAGTPDTARAARAELAPLASD